MVVFFDIDGTVVDNETQIIPESAVRAVAQLEKNGHIAVVNTGRPYGHLDPRIRAMSFSGWICGCGMELRVGNQWIHKYTPNPEICRHVLDAVHRFGMQATLETGDGGLLIDGEYSVHPAITREVYLLGKKGVEIREVSQGHSIFDKGVSYDWPGCDREGFLQAMEPYYTCIRRENTMIEFMPLGYSKAQGMADLLAHLGVDRRDTLAIGDSANDLPMFQAAGHSVCMGDGQEVLKARAEYVTAPVLEDGIEQALKHFGLI